MNKNIKSCCCYHGDITLYDSVVIPPCIIDNKNTLTQSMMKHKDTKYIIKYNFDLNGETITVPENCILEFDGGSLSNGIIVLNNTKIFPTFNDLFGNNLIILGNPAIGTYKYSDGNAWFFNGEEWKASSDQEALDELNNLIQTKADKSTTLAGYGINDAYTKEETDASLNVLDESIRGGSAKTIKEVEDSAAVGLGNIEALKGGSTSTINNIDNSISELNTALTLESLRSIEKDNQLQQLYENLTQTDVVPVPFSEWPLSNLSKKKIYRVSGTSSYTDYMYDETNDRIVSMGTYNNGIDDTPTSGSDNFPLSGGFRYRAVLCYLRNLNILCLRGSSNTISIRLNVKQTNHNAHDYITPYLYIYNLTNTFIEIAISEEVIATAAQNGDPYPYQFNIPLNQFLVYRENSTPVLIVTPTLLPKDIILVGTDNSGSVYGPLYDIVNNHHPIGFVECSLTGMIKVSEITKIINETEVSYLRVEFPALMDIYTNDRNTPFVRLSETVFVETPKNRGNFLVYNTSLGQFAFADPSEGDLIIGAIRDNYLRINGYAKIQYTATGDIVHTNISTSTIQSMIDTTVKSRVDIYDEEYAKWCCWLGGRTVDIRSNLTASMAYLEAYTARKVDIESGTPYDISPIIHLNKGEKLYGEIWGNDICGLALVTGFNSYKNIITLSGTSSVARPIYYVASNECDLVVCYRRLGTSWVKVSDSEFYDVVDGNTSFATDEASITFERFQKWKGNDECLVFPLISDIHTYVGDNAKYKGIDYCIATDGVFGYNFIGHLGDFGPANSSSLTYEQEKEILQRVSRCFNKYNGRIFFAHGNHDNDYSASLGFRMSDIANYMAQPTFNRFNDEFDINYEHHCFFRDYVKLKTRIMVVNTTDKDVATGGEYGMSDEQLTWIYNTLLSVPTGYCVVILEHFCPIKIGEWNSYISDTDYAYGADQELIGYVKMLEAFASHTSATYGSRYFDFTNVPSNTCLVGVFCGDSHFDANLHKNETLTVKKKVGGDNVNFDINGNGVNWLITQSYGIVSPTEIPSWATYTSFDYSSQLLIDVVAIKPKRRIFKVFRIGAGGNDRDREFIF